MRTQKGGKVMKARSFSAWRALSLIGLGIAMMLSVQPTEACGCGAYVPHDGDAFVLAGAGAGALGRGD